MAAPGWLYVAIVVEAQAQSNCVGTGQPVSGHMSQCGMKRAWLVIVSLSLFAAACGSDTVQQSTATTGAVGSSVAAAVATTVDSVATTTVVATTTGTEAPDITAGTLPLPLVPEAVCTGPFGEVYFAYDNQATSPVVVPDGAGNLLTGAADDDNPLRTTLFAPGRVEAAFWAFRVQATPLVWTLTGPDGVQRVATADDSLPLCAPGYPENTVDDPRTPALEITGTQLSAAGDSVEIQLELTGVPDTSVCNAAFRAEPVLVSIGDGSALPTTALRTASVTVPLYPEVNGPGKTGSAFVVPLVVDRCSGAGVTVSSWSAASALSKLAFGTSVCVGVDPAGVVTALPSQSPCGLPATGGSSIRPG